MQFKAVFIFVTLENYMLPCFTKKLLGIDCPGCGLQRSVLFLLQGEFSAAFEMYPGIYPLLLFLGFLGLNRLTPIKYANVITITLMVTTVGFILINYLLKFI